MQVNDIQIMDQNHYIAPQYAVWGRAGQVSQQVLENSVAAKVMDTMALDYPELVLKNLDKAQVSQVELYQGEEQAALKAYYIQYTRGEEFIFVLLEVQTNRLLGFTKMTESKASLPLIKHETAMNKALAFLTQHAADLISEMVQVEFEQVIDPAKRIEFREKPFIGKAEFQWIGEHQETFVKDGKTLLVTGQKVKMFIPSLNLFAWVIVDGDGEIITFERNVCWDFPNQMRLTQMWCHSNWLNTLVN